LRLGGTDQQSDSLPEHVDEFLGRQTLIQDSLALRELKRRMTALGLDQDNSLADS